MRMNMRNIAIAAIILLFVFVYTIHINWKQKKELASFANEIDVYEKHVDELTAKLNECMERKTSYGNKFESERKRSAKLQSDLEAAQAQARKSHADSSAEARQASDRVAELEAQAKLLTETRAALERENGDLKRQRAERLSNDTEALAALKGQLERALENEKQLRTRLDALENATRSSIIVASTEKPPLPTDTVLPATTGAAKNATANASSSTDNSTTAVGLGRNATTTAPLNISSNSSSSVSSSASPSAGIVESPSAVLRPPPKVQGAAAIVDSSRVENAGVGAAPPVAAAAAPAAADVPL